MDCFKLYKILLKRFGPQHWWPAEGPFEVIVGAILAQSTSWKNVEKAMLNLKREKLLAPKALRQVKLSKLQKAVRPAGYYKQKAKKLKTFINFLFAEYKGSLKKMFKTSTPRLRQKLLGVWGIGPETADSILLYAGSRPVFVIDAYTRRICKRLGLIDSDSYDELQNYFQQNLPGSVKIYNEFHALLVELGKRD